MADKTLPPLMALPALHKVPSTKASKDDPWAGDKLRRGAVARRLTRLIAGITQPFVIRLHGSYGTGKSYFLERWKLSLQAEGYVVVHFDAWKTDFSKDALAAFVAAMQSQFAEDPILSSAELTRKTAECVKSMAKAVAQRTLPILAKAAIHRLLGEAGYGEWEKALEAGSVGKVLLEDLVSSQNKAAQSIEVFSKTLSQFVGALSTEIPDPSKRKLIILVDELDRCRPGYAVEVLECVKHFFAVDGVVFVLALDEEQLRHSVRSVYGPGFDADGYLERFVDMRLRLPRPSHAEFVQLLWNDFRFDEIALAKKKEFLDLSTFIAEALDLSLRTQKRLFSLMNFIFRTVGIGGPMHTYGWLLPLIVSLRHSSTGVEAINSAASGETHEESGIVTWMGENRESASRLSPSAVRDQIQGLRVYFIKPSEYEQAMRSDFSNDDKARMKGAVNILRGIAPHMSVIGWLNQIAAECEELVADFEVPAAKD